jgi:acyl-CoA reductase-like NAD-dependent aldehyde dehydrogenase
MPEITLNAHDMIEHIGRAARTASRSMARANSAMKNRFLERVAALIDAERDRIMAANATDMQNAREAGRDEAFLDRLALNARRIDTMIAARLPPCVILSGRSSVSNPSPPVFRSAVCVCRSA